jgi:hypothetical protein
MFRPSFYLHYLKEIQSFTAHLDKSPCPIKQLWLFFVVAESVQLKLRFCSASTDPVMDGREAKQSTTLKQRRA